MKQAVGRRCAPLIHWAKQKPQTAVLGEFLYNVGFWGEYSALRAARGLRTGCKRLAARVWGVLKKIGGVIGGGLLTGWREITAPFTRFWRGIKNVNALIREEKKNAGRGHAFKEGLFYFGRGIRLYAPLLRYSFAYVLPLCALALFFYIVNTVLSYNYVLAVEVNGQVVGHVESEQVFDSAKSQLAQRIQTVGDEERTWNITPAFTLDVADTLLSEDQMVDAILRASSQDIQEGTALWVNGGLTAVTTEGDRLRELIDGMKAPYENPDDPNLRVEFNKEIELVDGVYFTDSITSYDSIADTLQGLEQGEQNYVVKSGDVPSTVAASLGLTTAELQAMNPQQDFSKSFYVGDVLLVQREQAYLEVRRIVTRTYEDQLDYTTEYVDNNDLAFGTEKTTQQGEEGIDLVTVEDVYYGSSEAANETREVDRVRVKDPVNRVVQRGKKLANGMLASTGSGTLLWPVPNYKYVSRWMSSGHKGADICAAYGSPIYASDSGVVVTAGYHYSYGNYVIIDHGNGYRTLYAHASRLAVGYGQAVEQGQVIAYVGSTGNSTGNHCHFEVYVNGVRRSAREWFYGK